MGIQQTHKRRVCQQRWQKVERSLDGQINEIVYKESHSHPKAQPNKRSSISQPIQNSGISDQSGHTLSNTMLDDSSDSIGEDKCEWNSPVFDCREDNDENDPECKRW